ncbi:MAG: InlB B-repeat-containing protein [Clostridia bacterium]
MKNRYVKKMLATILALCLIIALPPSELMAAETELNVTFDGNGGTPVSSVVKGTSTGTDLPDDPERQGYIFNGWNTANDATGDIFTAKTPVTEDVTVYAEWKANGIPVYYNANGGTPAIQKINGNLNGPVFPTAPTRSGYEFAGYNTKIDGSGFAFTGSTPVSVPVTVCAQWEIKEYTVIFSGAGGDLPYEETADGTINGTVFPAVTPIRSGHVLTGWSVTFGGSVDFTPVTPVTAVTTVYAVWAEDGYTVCFYGNGGEPAISTAIGSVDGVTLPLDPVFEGHTFKGWYKDTAGTVPYSNGDPITSDFPLYAIWEQETYDVTFDMNNDTQKTVTVKGSLNGTVLPQEPANGDLVFGGWNTHADGSGTGFISSTPVTAAITVYAQWSPYFVKFDAEGAQLNIGFDFTFSTTSDYAYPSIYYEQASNAGRVDIPAVFKNRPGYTFKEWNTKSDGTGDVFTADTVVTRDMTVYAVWEIDGYTVEFDAGSNAFFGSDKERYAYSQGTVNGTAFPDDPDCNEKLFLYYYYSPDGTENLVFTEDTPVTKNITVYAVYSGFQSSSSDLEWTTSYSVNGDTHTLTVISYTGSTADVTMPGTYIYGGNLYTLSGFTVDTQTYVLVYDDDVLSGNTIIESVTIPDEITEIYDGMFSGCVNLQTVYMSGSAVSSIGAAAFFNCVNLESVSLPASVTQIGQNTFAHCISLEIINLTDSLETVGSGAFKNCIMLMDTTKEADTILPLYIESIGSSAFIGSGLAGDLSLPCLLGLDSYAFAYCSGLTGVSFGNNTVNTAAGYTSFIADYAFYKCTDLASVSLGSLTRLYEYMFACTGVTAVEIPDTLTTVDDYAFYNCDKITEVIFADDAITGRYTFADCDRLETISIGTGTATLYDGLFLSCDSIQSVYLPEGVTTLYSAFAKCFSLRSVMLPETLTDVEDYAFAYDYNLKTLYYPTTCPPAVDVSYLSISGYNYRLDSDEEDEASEIFKLYFPVTSYDAWDINAPYTYDDNKNYWFPVSDVSLNNYNGTVTADRLVLNGSSMLVTGNAPSPLVREGMTFLGWSTVEGDASAIFDFSTTPVTSDLELYDCWEYTSYDITFMNEYNSSTYASGSTDSDGTTNDIPLTDPEREGYRFTGWNTDRDGRSAFITADTVFYADTSVYSIWALAYFNVQFHSNGGTPSVVTVKGTIAGTVLPTNITKAGYTLTGWKTETNEGFTSTTEVTEEMAVYAVWTKNSYTVTFNSNGGSPASSSAADIPVLNNHIFTGWNTAAGGGGIWYFNDILITENTAFYAQWEKHRCVVYYNPLNGDPDIQVTVDRSSKITGPDPAPQNNGYVLSGWYTDMKYMDKWDPDNDTVTDNMVLFAKWQDSSDIITITLDAQEGSVSPSSMSAIKGEACGSLPVPVRSGYTFEGWYMQINGGGLQIGSVSLTPAADLTLYAKWTVIPQTEDVIPAVITTGSDTMTTVTTSLSGSTDMITKTTSVTLTSSGASSLAANARITENEGKSALVEIKVEAGTQMSKAELTIPKDGFNELADTTDAKLKMETDLGSVTFDAESLETISKASASGDVTISIGKADAGSLPVEVQETVGDRPVYDFSVFAGDTQVTYFSGHVQIVLPYTLEEDEDPGSVVVYYLDDSGRLQTVRGVYDMNTKTVSFVTAHFSKYMIGYNKVSFKDVKEDAWYFEAVGFIAARNITNGVGDGDFDPEGSLTRAQFIVLILRAYGIEAEVSPDDNFADAKNTYYTGYLAAAKRLGIAKGTGNNMFDPDIEISRQDMFTLIYRMLDIIGEIPEETGDSALSDFTDANEVFEYAQPAMKALVSAGMIIGDSGKLRPNDSSTRAQMAQVLHNLLNR